MNMIQLSGLPGSPIMSPTRRLTYRQIADDLAERIRKGEYKQSEPIPSYSEVADMYTVSTSTAARAIALLVDRGVVYGEPGRGVFVA